MKHTLFILLSLFLVSCQSADKRKKDEITRLVNEWQGKEIVFPKDIIFTRFATDTVDYQVPESEYKVLIYVDSVGCTSCKLQLLKWKELIAYTDSLTNGSVPFLFFFHPKDIRELRYLFKIDEFDLPICIDTEDELNRLNRFPANMTFQTFLLNRDNKVVVIGNPIHNLSVKDLYLKQIGITNDQFAQGTQKTTAKAEVDEIDMGTIEKEETKQVIFKIRNEGSNPLVIVGTSVSCGCVVATFDKQPAEPGEALTLTVSMTPKESGFFQETIRVKCNTDQFIQLKIRGQVE